MLRTVLIGAVLIAVFFPATAFAVTASYSPHAEALAELNRIKPLQNPRYDTSKEILNRRILDRKNKVVGEVRDVILNDNGSISFLNIDFDRLNLAQSVPVNYGALKMEPVTDGYGMTFDSKEITDIYPTFLANIESAAGEEDVFALSKMNGMEVWNESGRRIGRVSDVLFAGNGARAEALYVAMDGGSFSGRAIAIPFSAPDFTQAATQRRLIVADEMADAMTTVAQNK